MKILKTIFNILNYLHRNNKESIIFDSYIDKHIQAIADILDIEVPPIQKMVILFKRDGNILGQDKFVPSAITSEDEVINGYFNDEINRIYIAQSQPYNDFFDRTYRERPFSNAELLYVVAHELRHVWQKTYHPEEFFEKCNDTVGVIDDISEIDADAFALAYVFSEKTTFTEEDFPILKNQVGLLAYMDEGQRWKKAFKYLEEYGFTDESKLKAFIESFDQVAIAKRAFFHSFV